MPQTTYTHRRGPAGPALDQIIWGGIVLPILPQAPDLYAHRNVGPASFAHRTAPVPSSSHRAIGPPSFAHRPGAEAPPLEVIIWGGMILPILAEAPDLYAHRGAPVSSFVHRAPATPAYTHRAVIKPA